VQKVRNLKPKWFVQVHLDFKLFILIFEDSQGRPKQVASSIGFNEFVVFDGSK
jgi:hypothetical protein